MMIFRMEPILGFSSGWFSCLDLSLVRDWPCMLQLLWLEGELIMMNDSELKEYIDREFDNAFYRTFGIILTFLTGYVVGSGAYVYIVNSIFGR